MNISEPPITSLELDEPQIPDHFGIPTEAFLDPSSHMDYIAHGSFGEVYRYESLAVKIEELAKRGYESIYNTKLRDQLHTEVTTNEKLSHENIVKFIGSFELKNKLYIILEYIDGGSLMKYLKEKNGDLATSEKTNLTDSEMMQLIKDILTGLAYLHSNNIMHRDMRAANILRTKANVLKITDFGLSKEVGNAPDDDYCSTFVSQLSLVPFWQPPERIKSWISDTTPESCQDRQNLKYDVWMVGIVFLEITCVKAPHFLMTPHKMQFQVIYNDYVPEVPDFVPIKIKNMITKCLNYKIDERPSSAELLESIEFESIELQQSRE